MTTIKRIGWACKMMPPTFFSDRKEEKAWVEAHNLRGTTVTHLNKLSRAEALAKIIGIIEHNIQALKNQFEWLGAKPLGMRMIRFGSDVLPARTHEDWKRAYEDPAVIRVLQGFGSVGELARLHNIRLSTHPGQFTMLCSNSVVAIERAMEDLEYHAEVFRLMGFDGSDQSQEINIHGGANREDFLEEFERNWRRLSADTRQWLSVENDEFSYSLDRLLPLSDKVKILLDINHHWIHHGEYISPSDPRLERVIDSWRGARPEMHVAWPDRDVLVDHDPNTLPDMTLLESRGFKRSKLRAHSDDNWNNAISNYALEFWDRFDLMCECKFKNLTAQKLYDIAVKQ